MRLNIRLMGIVHGILLIALIGYYVLRGSFGGSSAQLAVPTKGGSAVRPGRGWR